MCAFRGFFAEIKNCTKKCSHSASEGNRTPDNPAPETGALSTELQMPPANDIIK